MGSVEEKRVFDEALSATRLLVTSSLGVTFVDVADGRIGEFGLLSNDAATDITQTPTGFAVATTEDVVLISESTIVPTGFGPAEAVTWAGSGLTAADNTAHVATYNDNTWTTIGSLPSPVNAMDGPFVATDDGIFRLNPDLTHVGLSAVNDVSAEPIPRAATRTGLYELGNGWHQAVDGEFQFVATWVRHDDTLAYAATQSALYERDPTWREIDHPFSDPIIDVAFTTYPFFITTTGALGVRHSDWQMTSLGLPNVTGIANTDP